MCSFFSGLRLYREVALCPEVLRCIQKCRDSVKKWDNASLFGEKGQKHTRKLPKCTLYDKVARLTCEPVYRSRIEGKGNC